MIFSHGWPNYKKIGVIHFVINMSLKHPVWYVFLINWSSNYQKIRNSVFSLIAGLKTSTKIQKLFYHILILFPHQSDWYSWMGCSCVNQLTGFYMRSTLALNGLNTLACSFLLLFYSFLLPLAFWKSLCWVIIWLRH